MPDMPRPRPPFLTREIRGAKVYWYFRRDKGPRIPLPGAYGSKEFLAAYEAALAGKPLPGREKAGAGSLGWLVARYMDSSAWARLSPATRRQRGLILAKVKDAAGTEPYTAITRKTIIDGRERRADRPAAARHFIETLRGMFQWALDAQLVEEDPTRDVKATMNDEAEAEVLDLLDLLPPEVLNHPDCFHSVYYDRWERDVATPALRAAGYEPSGWRTTDGDSFGPLVRGVTLTKDGVPQDYFYG